MNVLTSPGAATADVAAMVARRTVGYSLESDFYTSPEVYDLDLDLIFGRHWLFCATAAEIAEPGDFVTVDIGSTSVIIVRDDDEEIRAWHNVCRHRGSRILDARCGVVGNLVCPYHQWTYRTDGTLIFAESPPADFDRSRHGLKPVHVQTMSGLVFICLSDDPPADFAEVAALAEPYLAPYRLAEAKVAHQIDLVEHGNWKLTMENNRECYHCDAGHPELVDTYFPFYRYTEDEVTPRLRPAYERYQVAVERLDSACAVTKIPRDTLRELDTRPTAYQIHHIPLDGEGASYGPGGKRLCAKLMGEITEARLGDLSLHMQPNAWLHMLGDHAVVFWILPLSVDKTLVRTTWLVHPDAVEGVDYDVDALTHVWRATNEQDSKFVERTQRGVGDPGYQPGPYSTIEDDVEAFVSWYIGRLREALVPADQHVGLAAIAT